MIRRSYEKIAAAVLFALLLAGCATGVPFAEFSKTIPPLAAGKGRIVIYRDEILGAAIQPSVRLNGIVIGSAVPGGFFYVDRPAGNYTVSAETEVKRGVSFSLAPDQYRYVRLDVGAGFLIGRIIPVLVDNPEAIDEVSGLRHVEK